MMLDAIFLIIPALCGVGLLIGSAMTAFEECEKPDPTWWPLVTIAALGCWLIATAIYWAERMG